MPPSFSIIMAKVREQFESSKTRKRILIIALIVGVLVSAVYSLTVGAISIPTREVVSAIGNWILPGLVDPPSNPAYKVIIVEIRIPRVLTAILVGTSLAVAGVVMQGLLRNPLVSPFTLGVSSAASFGAVVAIVFSGAVSFISGFSIEMLGTYISGTNLTRILFAFGAGMLSIFAILFLSHNRRLSPSVMVLSGVVLGYFFQAGVMFMKYVSDNSQLREVTNWLMGGFASVDWSTFIVLCPIVLITTAMMVAKSVTFNSLSCGEEVARNLGVNTESTRRYCLVTITFATCACMSFTGVIGFIGLMAPHICRMIIGNDHRYLLPCSALMGAFILLVSDTAGRIIAAPEEMPVGVIMYILGGIFFAFLIFRGRGSRLES